MNDNESIIDDRALQPLPIVLHVLLYLWWGKSDDRAPTPITSVLTMGCWFPPIRRLIASPRFRMHPCLGVDEILSLFARELVASGAKATAVALARCCRSFEESVLDALWETQEQLTPLLKCIPGDVWEEGDSVSPVMAFDFPALNRSV